MKLLATFRILICTGFVSLLSLSAHAHTALEQSTPGAGAVVTAAPGHINLTFNSPVKLVKLELMGAGHEMPTKFESNAEPKAAFMIETPGMHPGAFTVNWAAIGADGHTVTNSYGFTVDPDAAEAAHSHDGGDADHGHSHGGGANPH